MSSSNHTPVSASSGPDGPRRSGAGGDAFTAAAAWLQAEADRIIRAARRDMADGTAAFPPQVGLGYDAFWLRDYAYALEGSPASFTTQELLDACRLFVRSIDAEGNGVDCIRFDGTPIYKPGMGTMGEYPVADGGPFTVHVAYCTYRQTGDVALLHEVVEPLIKTLAAVPRNPSNGLVHIDPTRAWDRCPYGFTDTIGKQGDLLFCSLLFVQAARQLAEMLTAAERADHAHHWSQEAERIAAAVRVVFWDPETGLFRAATSRCREHDLWGSAFAVFLGVADSHQARRIAVYFQTHYHRIVQHGQIRHLPAGVYWEHGRERDRYQNGGYWATPTGWFIYTLALVDRAAAERTIVDLVDDFRAHGANEWMFGDTRRLPHYLASAALPLAGIRALQARLAADGDVPPSVGYDLSALDWRVAGFIPHDWRNRTIEQFATTADVAPVPMAVPGSIQAALLAAGVIPDWNDGLNARACEWVENRHWVVFATLPDAWCAGHGPHRLQFGSLDYTGIIRVNGREAGSFRGSFEPHGFEVGEFLIASGNTLEIVFTEPPRWLGQLGYTSQMTQWKTRFNYTWDWTSRVVQLGIAGRATWQTVGGALWQSVRCTTSVAAAVAVAGTAAVASAGATVPVAQPPATTGVVTAAGRIDAADLSGLVVHAVMLDAAGRTVAEETLPAAVFVACGLRWAGLSVRLWWPNGAGEQPLYYLQLRLTNRAGVELDRAERTIGFRSVEWQPCSGAPADARPWLCTVNGRPLFLQGINWTPIRPTYADVTAQQVRERLVLYRDLGCNIVRVWGGATLESQEFYETCNELGLLVWQEFPLSSSGFDNWPPEDPQAIAEMSAIAASYIARRAHHPALIIWCGGNELQGALDGGKQGIGKPVDESHPMIAALAAVVARDDPGRRFLPTSSSGPRFGADAAEFGQGLHHDVHGPWQLPEATLAGAERYWAGDDALFRSEVGVPGASPLDIITEYAGGLEIMPASAENPLWRRTSWWIQWPEFLAEIGREPTDVAEFVAWSQERQARGLAIAARACKNRFPRCGGFIVWMGHDCFPCTANTSIVDYHGRPKPAAGALAAVFHAPAGSA